MRRKLIFTLFALLLVGSMVLSAGLALAEEDKTQFFGILIYRTGPFAAGGSGFGSGWEDFMELRNMQGGVNGIKYAWEECETAYNTARGVECVLCAEWRYPLFPCPGSQSHCGRCAGRQLPAG